MEDDLLNHDAKKSIFYSQIKKAPYGASFIVFYLKIKLIVFESNGQHGHAQYGFVQALSLQLKPFFWFQTY